MGRLDLGPPSDMDGVVKGSASPHQGGGIANVGTLALVDTTALAEFFAGEPARDSPS